MHEGHYFCHLPRVLELFTGCWISNPSLDGANEITKHL